MSPELKTPHTEGQAVIWSTPSPPHTNFLFTHLLQLKSTVTCWLSGKAEMEAGCLHTLHTSLHLKRDSFLVTEKAEFRLRSTAVSKAVTVWRWKKSDSIYIIFAIFLPKSNHLRMATRSLRCNINNRGF